MKLTSLTAVFIARDFCASIETVRALADALAERVVDVNIIIVANGAGSVTARTLNALASAIPDVTVLYLATEQHDDVARLLGIEQAIGDYILFCTPTLAEIADLDKLLAPAVEGNDLVVGRRRGGRAAARGPFNRLCFFIFRHIFYLATAKHYAENPPTFRLLTRTAALHIAASSDSEVQIRSSEIGPGFPVKIVDLPDAPAFYVPGIGLRPGISRAIRLLVTTSSFPLRLISYIGMVGGLSSLLYAIFAVAMWLTKPDIAPGWTSLSLQLSGMCFLMSLMFFLIAEYLMQIFASLPLRSRRHLISREVTSQVFRRQNRLNVVDEKGDFQIGMPDEYARRPSPLTIDTK
jgi:hypothetical protein